MDSGTSGGSMQSGSSGEDDQNETNFSPSPLSIPSLNHHHQNLVPQAQAQAQSQAHTQLHQQPLFSSQHLHLYPPLTNTTRDDHHMINPYQSLSSHNSFLETLPQSDLDRIWSMGLNSHPQSHHQQHHQQQQQHDNQQQQQMFYSAASSSAMNNPSPQDPQQKLQPTGKLSTTQPGKENGSLSSGRVVKKRTRASRKTPTTVLTTDTTNFRAMVQEFTGIPTPPFGPSPLFPAKKFDLFNPNNNNNSLDPSLGSLLFSLNKANHNNNPNPNPFPPPPPLITTTTASLSANPNPYHHHQQQQQSQSQQMLSMMMMPSGSNSNLLYVNIPQGHQNQNPNLTFQQTSLRQVEVDQQAGYSKGENDNFSGTS